MVSNSSSFLLRQEELLVNHININIMDVKKKHILIFDFFFNIHVGE
jgi:hypothetical protein